ncbi:MAG: response regulator, partial [Candidatus Fimimonas sp.]
MTPKKQILVVEDNVLNRELLVAILEDDYDTLQAENGLEALEILKQHKDEIALILLDVMMPVMDGFTFLDNVKQDEELSLIPVIVTTQSDGEADEVEALARGATDFVPKPYKPQVILHRIASIIKLRETAAMVNQFQYDRLTGLFSREFFLQKARDVLDENPDVNYTIVCSNIENFKLYNDTYGRQGGDDLLKNAAAMIREVVGNNGVCCRYGADRFIVMQESNAEKEFRNNFFVRTEDTPVYKKENLSVKWGIYEITDRS